MKNEIIALESIVAGINKAIDILIANGITDVDIEFIKQLYDIKNDTFNNSKQLYERLYKKKMQEVGNKLGTSDINLLNDDKTFRKIVCSSMLYFDEAKKTKPKNIDCLGYNFILMLYDCIRIENGKAFYLPY